MTPKERIAALKLRIQNFTVVGTDGDRVILKDDKSGEFTLSTFTAGDWDALSQERILDNLISGEQETR